MIRSVTFRLRALLATRQKQCYRVFSTIQQEEVDKFSRISTEWWQENGEFGALHSMNELRMPWIREKLLGMNVSTPSAVPLEGLHLTDVGCGGGLLCEPLARLGASVTGVDASEENIAVAQYHAQCDPDIARNITYCCKTVEELASERPGSQDAVVASEVVEHVADAPLFVSACCALVRPGGAVFFTTINRTLLARVLAVWAAEKVLRLVPDGAHDWDKFVTPEELASLLREQGFTVDAVRGMILNPLTSRWSWTDDASMNYALSATKPL